MNIALKEASESEYWIELLIASKIHTKEKVDLILKDCIEVKKILHSIVNTCKSL